jgi:hypothetical protein
MTRAFWHRVFVGVDRPGAEKVDVSLHGEHATSQNQEPVQSLVGGVPNPSSVASLHARSGGSAEGQLHHGPSTARRYHAATWRFRGASDSF